jgi:transposase
MILAVVDGLGSPIRIHPTAGNANDIVLACDLITGLEAEMTIAVTRNQGSKPVIPPKSNRLEQREFDRHLYKERYLVESFFAKIKVFRRISTCYEKLAVTFRAAVLIAACTACLQ